MENLTQIAQTLKSQAQSTHRPAQQTLDFDLTITVQYNPKSFTWTLSLTKLYHHATPEERQECKEAFGVPEDTDFEVKYQNGWGVIRYQWSETKQLEMKL